MKKKIGASKSMRANGLTDFQWQLLLQSHYHIAPGASQLTDVPPPWLPARYWPHKEKCTVVRNQVSCLITPRNVTDFIKIRPILLPFILSLFQTNFTGSAGCPAHPQTRSHLPGPAFLKAPPSIRLWPFSPAGHLPPVKLTVCAGCNHACECWGSSPLTATSRPSLKKLLQLMWWGTAAASSLLHTLPSRHRRLLSAEVVLWTVYDR